MNLDKSGSSGEFRGIPFQQGPPGLVEPFPQLLAEDALDLGLRHAPAEATLADPLQRRELLRGRAAAEVVAVVAEFDVEAEKAQADVLELLAQLESVGAVRKV